MKIHLLLLMFILLPIAIEAQRQAPKREVALEGAVNFRDLGGYATTNYRRIAIQRVYRAGDISKLTDSDMEELKRRKIYTVIDFRGEDEAAAAPDRLLPGAGYLLLPAGSGNATDLAAFIRGHTSGTDAMVAFYSDISVFTEKYRPFFRKLLMLPDTSAVVFHCTAGKDRTGIAAALFLYVLDIPMETIMADYMATNLYRKVENEKMIDYLVNERGIDRRMATEIMEANPLYLEATFGALKRKYGSIDSFLYKEMGMDEPAKLRFREKFLQ
ncbi:MAG: tyrosine-protein phosphatase [Bacteroidales bacterium]|jgi:protein-tyrosine phosphatase|nr:tyrosine-protein phosphatase [Bacteroidales bacterium]